MPKVIVTGQVEDPVKWEEGFRTHGELLRSMTIKRPINFSTIEGNEVAISSEPDDLKTFMDIMDSPAVAEAMKSDGFKQDTVKIFVLDKEFKV